MKKCFQVLFNRPLQLEDGVLYGVRVPYDETRMVVYTIQGSLHDYILILPHLTPAHSSV